MKTRMDQLINGRFEYDVPGLILSTEKIVLKIMPEEKLRGELEFAAEDRRKNKREWHNSTHRRFLLGKEKFAGEKIILPYGIDAKGLKSEDKIEGEMF